MQEHIAAGFGHLMIDVIALDESVLDHTLGSWFHQLDENNNLKGTVWPGKSDLYHAFQAMLIPYNETDTSIAKAIWLKKEN